VHDHQVGLLPRHFSARPSPPRASLASLAFPLSHEGRGGVEERPQACEHRGQSPFNLAGGEANDVNAGTLQGVLSLSVQVLPPAMSTPVHQLESSANALFKPGIIPLSPRGRGGE